MKWFRTDQLFEEAALSPEACDRLLLRLRKARTACFWWGLGFIAICLAVCVFVLWMLFRYIQTFPASPPPWLDWLLKNQGVFWVVAPPIVIGIATQCGTLRQIDTWIKMLILFRTRFEKSID